MATLLLVIIYLAFIALGLPDSLLGAAWPVAHAELNVPVTMAGFVSIVTTGGTVVSSLVSARVIHRLGTGAVTFLSVLMTAAALMLISCTRSFAVILLLAVPLGLGAGSIDTALNNYVALHYRNTHMNWLHCFWGVGAMSGPLIISAFLAGNGGWHGGYRTVSFVLFGIALLLACATPLWARVGGKAQAADGSADEPIVSMRALLRLPGALLSCLAFFGYCALEYGAGLWASTYFVSVRGVSPDVGAAWASLFYFGIMASRLLSGFAAIKLGSRTLIRIGLCVVLAGVVVLLLSLPGLFPAAGLLLVGFGCGPVFPSMIDQTPQLFGARASQGVIGLELAGSYLGGTLLSPMFGWISPIVGFSAWPVYLLIVLVLLTACIERKYVACGRAAGPSDAA